MRREARPLLRSIAVVGDGQVGFGAAIALKRALPAAEIMMIPCAPDPSALCDRAISSLPRTSAFHARIGLKEDGLIEHAGGSHRVAVRFRNWHPNTDYFHAHGAASSLPGMKLDSVSQFVARANRFALPPDDASLALSDLDYGLRFNPAAYHRRLALFGQHLGLRRAVAGFESAVNDGKGGLASVTLTDGSRVTADLYVDCTGPAARLAKATGAARFESWSGFLPCDRLLTCAHPAPPALSVLDEVVASPVGWMSTVNGRDGTHRLIAYSSKSTADDDAMKALGAPARQPTTISQGRLAESWLGNVAAFGDAAATIEPLLWTNLTLAHEQIMVFIELLPGRDMHDLERREYNRRAAAMADRVRDFLALHYHGPARPKGAFWDACDDLERPASLALTMSEFGRRGRLPFFEEDILPRDAWLSAFECVGIHPGRSAIAAGMTDDQIAMHRSHQQARNASALQMAVPYSHWLQTRMGVGA